MAHNDRPPEWKPPAHMAGDHHEVMELPGQQAGKTTRQLLAAPPGAVYVWVNHHLDYPKELARSLGREDLRIVSPSWLCDQNLRASENKLILDHAAPLTLRRDQWQALRRHDERMEERKNAQR